MPKKHILTEIDGRKIKLSNPTKVLYPTAGVMKAQLIQYYISVAEYILPFLEQRPLTLIRYPDGVEANRFYSKNRPSWTPSWVGSVQVDPEDDNIYSMANDIASLAWMANLATLEFHPMTIKATHLGKPDHIIFDLDPPENWDFQAVKELALDLNSFLRGYAYHPFVKLSGSKGIHIYVPIVPQYEQSVVIESIKALGKKYIAHNPETTLKMSKEQRKGKILLDIYRNSRSQTCVAPFSTRGRAGCPISMPLDWEELPDITTSQAYNIHTALDKIQADGNPWASFYEHAQPLHDKEEDSATKPEKLKKYDQKRDFKSTAEPTAAVPEEYVAQNRYCVQIHDASNLHYDLRLEDNGVLLSWAIPKGIPIKKGLKRLAIETEPHPIKYLTFEGTIPKGEYGGGEMWVFDSGTYTVQKKEEKKIYFSLDGHLAGEYRIFNTKDKQWLLERIDETTLIEDISRSPMLASATEKIPAKSKYFYEIKWDGIRIVVTKKGKEVKIISRKGNDLTDKFPLIVKAISEMEAEGIIMDGEIVALDENGVPNFAKTVGRMHLTGKDAIARASKRTKTVIYLFDCLYLDGRDIRKEPIERRRDWLRVNLRISEHLRYSDTFEDGKALFQAIEAQNMEGIMCKLKGSEYKSDARTKYWLKMKVSKSDEAYIIGYTEGKGDRQGLFGSLQLAKKDGDKWIYMGRVGTGFTQEKLKEVLKLLLECGKSKKLIKQSVDEESRSRWIIPHYIAEVKYASMSSNDTYREPVFMGMRLESED